MANSVVERQSPVIEPLLELSRADNWEEASKEWRVAYVVLDVIGKCICGKEGIKKVCHITNSVTQRKATVGSKCVEQVNGESFAQIHAIMEASLRIAKSPTAVASSALIEHAYARRIFNQRERDSYLDVASRGDRALREESLIAANRKLRRRMEVQSEFQRLTEDAHHLANHTIVAYACQRKLLAVHEMERYNQFREELPEKEISASRRPFIDRMNQKILTGLSRILESRREEGRGEKRGAGAAAAGAGASAAAAAEEGAVKEPPSKRGRQS